MSINDKTGVSDSDLVSVPEDFEAGDFVYIDLSTDDVLLGTVVKSTEAELELRMPSGKREKFNKHSDPPLSYVMRNIGKPPSLFALNSGVIVSRLNMDSHGGNFREYAKVIRSECGRGIVPYLIEIEYLDKEKSGMDITTYTTGYQVSLDRQMRYWTIEE